MPDALSIYARALVNTPEAAGKLHRQALARHLEDLERQSDDSFPYRFDAEKASKACKFFRLLKHYKGEWSGQPIVLEPWQEFIVGSVFGWLKKDSGLRRFRVAYIECPRKNGKSLLAAGVALYATFADGEPGAEGYVAAMKRDQAQIVFEDAKRLVKSSRLNDVIKVQARNLHNVRTASKLEPLSADYDSMDGLNVQCCVLDEYHAQKDRGMVDVIETAMGARRQPLLFEITTAGADPLSPCADMREYCAKILEKTFVDESIFAFIAHADADDDPYQENTWRKSNPNYGVSVKPEDLKALAQKAVNMPSALSAFKQKRLNIWVSAGEPWLPMDAWTAGQSSEPQDVFASRLEGQVCYLGLDLSSKLDLSALVAMFPPNEQRTSWMCLPWLWTPEGGLEEREKRYRAPLSVWIDRGYLQTMPGQRIDQSVIKEAIADCLSRFDVRRIGFDPWNIGNLDTDVLELFNDGPESDRVIEVPQNFRQMSEPSKEFEAEVSESRIDANGHPVMAWNVSNAVLDVDSNGNIRPTKNPRKLRGRIDGLIAAVIAMKVARADLNDGDAPEFYTMDMGGHVSSWG